MTEYTELELLHKFVEKCGTLHVESTGASITYQSDTMYNVDGSDNDPKKIPKHVGSNWRPLMIALGISASSKCYVTTAKPAPAASHPNFNAGGHVTPNSDGTVAAGGTCYLMPLCSSHNGKSFDEVAFTHTETKMVELTGYMEPAELPATFMARLPSEETFAVLYPTNDGWQSKKLHADDAADLSLVDLPGCEGSGAPEHYVLIERQEEPMRSIYVVREANLPDA